MGDTGPYSVTVLLFNSRLKKHIQVSDTDNFTKIEMTAVESTVQVIEGEILLWEEFPYSCYDPSLNSAMEGSSSPD